MPLISVIVPVYRAEATLRACVESILAQSCGDYELLLIEDGSPDGSGALCDALAREDNRIRVFHQENAGASAARNTGLRNAQGQYVCFVDSDDTAAPQLLQVLRSALETSGADAACCGFCRVEQDGTAGPAQPPVLPQGVYEKEEIMAGVVDKLLGERLAQPLLPGFIWRFLYTRKTMEGMAFHGRFQEDELFLLEYLSRCPRLCTVDEPCYFYHDSAQSLVHSYLCYRPDFPDLFSAFLAEKDAVVERCGIGGRIPLWRENTCWAGLLAEVGNEMAPGSGRSFFQQTRRLRELAQQPDMAHAVETYVPDGMGRNRQLSADLLRKHRYGLLALLYRVKNAGR